VGWLLEGILVYDVLECLELQSVTGGHDVVEVDGLDERLDLRPLGGGLLGHTLGDLGWVSLNSGNESVSEGVGLSALFLHYSPGKLVLDSLLRRNIGSLRKY